MVPAHLLPHSLRYVIQRLQQIPHRKVATKRLLHTSQPLARGDLSNRVPIQETQPPKLPPSLPFMIAATAGTTYYLLTKPNQ